MNVRRDFPILGRKINGKQLIYFDNAATTQKPRQVVDAVADFYLNHNGNVGRGLHTLSTEATEAYENARKKVARFINAKADEIVFTHNATHSLNLVAQSYGLRRLGKFDEVVMTVMEHHSNYVPWRLVCEKTKARLKLVDIGDDGLLDLREYEKTVGKNTNVVSVTHVSNVLGTVNPVREMAKTAHENGAWFVLDGAQSVPHMAVDAKKIDCDFLAFSGHKMLGPTGIGVLYGKADLLEDLEPLITGGGMIQRTYPGDIQFLKPPQRFDAGTPNVGGAVGLAAAIDYLDRIGMDKIEKHEKGLTRYALSKLEKIEKIKLYGPEDKAGIISFNVSGLSPHDVATILDEQGIEIRSGHHCCQPLMNRLHTGGTARMSFYLYNTKQEVDYTVGVLEKLISLG
jgi:cysteine desulfurase/selenocysteine lyase